MINKERIARIVENMKREGLRQIIITSTASLYYLTDLWIDPHERMIALLLNDKGEARLFGNEIFGLSSTGDLPFYGSTDNDNPIEKLAEHLLPGEIGIDKFWSSNFLIELMRKKPQIKPTHGSGPVDAARRLKDAAEIEKMKYSSAINDKVIGMIIDNIKEGDMESNLVAEINRLFREHGADSEGPQIAAFGANAADPHHMAGSTKLKSGDGIVFDIFTPINRYWCDMTRTVFYKEASERAREVYELVKTANEAAIKAVKPGVPLSELDGIARGIITAGGYGDYFTHRLGHGIGIECHEPPDVSAASDEVCAPGMIFSIEPGIYLPGELGVRIEDLVLVTADGCEVLNNYTKELQVLS